MEIIYNKISEITFLIPILLLVLGFGLALNKGKIPISFVFAMHLSKPPRQYLSLGNIGIIIGIISGVLGSILTVIHIGIYFGWFPEKLSQEVITETVYIIEDIFAHIHQSQA